MKKNNKLAVIFGIITYILLGKSLWEYRTSELSFNTIFVIVVFVAYTVLWIIMLIQQLKKNKLKKYNKD